MRPRPGSKFCGTAKKAPLYCLLFLWVGHFPASGAEVIYQENFDRAENGTEVRALGWRIQATPEQSTYVVRDGVLEVTCWPETYHGGYAEPVPLQPQSAELAAGLAWEPAPCVLYRHDLPLREGTEVLLKAGDQPLLVKGTYGEGEVFVFLGAPCGTAARALRFWEWPPWPTFLARVIAPGGHE